MGIDVRQVTAGCMANDTRHQSRQVQEQKDKDLEITKLAANLHRASVGNDTAAARPEHSGS
ncbi:hypothetical protein PV772_15070 [Pseudarthrobacter sp. CC12]|uniref:hypothetical protein n=1 Tax=Pseudarthrobacter sp. CC12 TaxID=3029193 RepID=UPI003266CDDE